MKCHYEILGLSKDATDDEIKKSYRKLALKWHPDKNPDNVEEVTKIFLGLQSAYDVLSDPQERAWYDKHRDAILRGGLGKGEYEDKSLDVYVYFNTSCFSGYGNDEKGFYVVYGEVFEKLSQEDYEFMDEKECEFDFPKFGKSDSIYTDVVGPFYAFWESFCTAKSYVWEEKYDPREAPNRQVRRAIEQENKKFRDKAKKDRNEEVRALVSYVRKRDKRVQAHKKELLERAAEIAKKTEEKKKKEVEKRRKELESYEETKWSAMSVLEKDLKVLDAQYAAQFGDEDDITDDAENEEEEEDLDNLFCVACNRIFRTDKAFANHENSKKHKENVVFLKSQMQSEDAEFNKKDTAVESTGDADAKCEIEEAGADCEMDDDELMEEDTDEEEYLSSPTSKKLSKKQKKKQKKLQQAMNHLLGEVENAEVENITIQDKESETLISEMEAVSLITNSNSSTIENGVCETPEETSGSPNDACKTSEETSESPLEMNSTSPQSSLQVESQEPVDNTEPETQTKKKKPPEKQTQGIPQVCNKCCRTFKSKNKLFEHIKVTGHALHVDTTLTPDTIEDHVREKTKKKKVPTATLR